MPREAQTGFCAGNSKKIAGWTTLMSALLVLILFVLIHPPTQAQTEDTPIAPASTPTIDRLAAPPTVERPTQADDGAQLYWLHCQPCHGDVGQGLTDDWRAQYPPEDQYCWDSGCHGNRPYESGFILPKVVPPLIGDGSLVRFETLGQLYTFTRNAMPFQMPGHLSDDEYLAIIAFLARAHDVGNEATITIENVSSFPLRPLATQSIDEQPQTVADDEAEITQAAKDQPSVLIGLGVVVILIIIAGGFWLWRRYRL
jgi:cytochrome c